MWGASVLTESVLRSVTDPNPVNLAFGSRVSLLELLEVLEDILGTPIARQHLDPRPGDVRDSQADQTRLRALFPDVGPVGTPRRPPGHGRLVPNSRMTSQGPEGSGGSTGDASAGGPVVLLAGPGDSTDIVANYLARHVQDLVVVLEGGQSRTTLAQRPRRGWVG